MAMMQHEVIICMGSSCFSRGNNRNIEVIQGFLDKRGLEGEVEIRGHLCEDECKVGPNVEIDGTALHDVHPVMLEALLRQHLACECQGGSACSAAGTAAVAGKKQA